MAFWFFFIDKPMMGFSLPSTEHSAQSYPSVLVNPAYASDNQSHDVVQTDPQNDVAQHNPYTSPRTSPRRTFARQDDVTKESNKQSSPPQNHYPSAATTTPIKDDHSCILCKNDSLQSKSSSAESTDFPPCISSSGGSMGYCEGTLSSSTEDVSSGAQFTKSSTHHPRLLKPSDSGGTTYSSSSRKSSATDSAIDLHLGSTSDGDSSPVPNTCSVTSSTQHPLLVSADATELPNAVPPSVVDPQDVIPRFVASPDLGYSPQLSEPEVPPITGTRKRSFADAQTPSFTKTQMPPSVIISDHSQEHVVPQSPVQPLNNKCSGK